MKNDLYKKLFFSFASTIYFNLSPVIKFLSFPEMLNVFMRE